MIEINNQICIEVSNSSKWKILSIPLNLIHEHKNYEINSYKE